jgi:hypothetical protein
VICEEKEMQGDGLVKGGRSRGCRRWVNEKKWQGVLGSVLGEQQPRTPGDSGFVSKKRKPCPLAGGLRLLLLQEGERRLP